MKSIIDSCDETIKLLETESRPSLSVPPSSETVTVTVAFPDIFGATVYAIDAVVSAPNM